MKTKKKNALFGRYPACDLLNNAIRFIRNGQTEAACEAIIQAIDEANGYFHQDNALFIDEVRLRRSAKRNFIVKRIYAQEQERLVE